MSLFTPDLYRNFAIGFALGAVGLVAANAANGGDALESPAHAATPLEAPAQSPEFAIDPLEIVR